MFFRITFFSCGDQLGSQLAYFLKNNLFNFSNTSSSLRSMAVLVGRAK